MTTQTALPQLVTWRRPALAALLAICAWALCAPTSALAASCDLTATPIIDRGVYRWDMTAFAAPTPFRGYAYINDGGRNSSAQTPAGPYSFGPNDSYDDWGGMIIGASTWSAANGYHDSGNMTRCTMAMGGQEIDYAAVPVQGLTVQRKFYVDPTADGVRILNVVSNPTAAAITTSVQTGEAESAAWGDLGSDASTVVQLSSDGSQSITAASRWAITNDGLGSDPATTTAGDPTLLHYWDGKGGSDRADFAIGGTSTAPATGKDQLAYRWDNVTIEPGQTAVLMSYEVQKVLDTGTGTTRAFAKAEIDALASADVVRLDSNRFVSLYAGMSAAEIAGTRNWAHPPVVAAFTAQDSTAGQVVNFDAAGSHGYTAIAACVPLTQSWDYGDGTTGAASSHSYAHGGSYTVTEKVSACGSSDTTSRVLAIRPAAPALDSTPTAVSRLASFAFSGDGTDGFSCSIDAGEFQPCGSPYAAKVADGNHTFALRQTVGGQTSDVVSYAWRLDRTALAPAITATPKKKTKSKTAIFKFTGEAGAKFTCKLDKRAAAACTSPVKYKRLKPGKHRFTVFQTDAAGNISTATTKRWTIVKPKPRHARR